MTLPMSKHMTGPWQSERFRERLPGSNSLCK